MSQQSSTEESRIHTENSEKASENTVEAVSSAAEKQAGGEEERSAGDTPSVDKSWEDRYHELHDQYIRLAADFENFRKRYLQERESLLKYGAERTAVELLPTLDNLERAMKSLSEQSDAKMLYQSFGLLANQLLGSLEAVGIQKIAAVGQPFDSTFHEAISKMPSPDYPEDTVMHETETGYMLHDRVLRPAKVIVSAGQEEVLPSRKADEPSDDSAQPAASCDPPSSAGKNPFKQAGQ